MISPVQIERRRLRGMKQRCYNPKAYQYKNYGGRGIVICDRWLESFENFYQYMGPCPPGMSLDRIDNNGPYSPENCRWATPEQQRLNQRACVVLEYQGQCMTVEAWARKLGRHPTTIRSRIKAGWRIQDILDPGTQFRNRNSSPRTYSSKKDAA